MDDQPIRGTRLLRSPGPSATSTAGTPGCAILDVDGTLVDSNYQHALAWHRAFARFDVVLPVARLHRHVGMGGDQFVRAVGGDAIEERIGDELRTAHGEIFAEDYLDGVLPIPGARVFLEDLAAAGVRVVLSSSATEDEVTRYLDLLDARSFVTAWTTAGDVSDTKPEPDLVEVALRHVPGARAVMVGDTPWDCIAATRAGIGTVAVLTGGFCRDELRDAGAVEIRESVGELGRQPGWFDAAAHAPAAK